MTLPTTPTTMTSGRLRWAPATAPAAIAPPRGMVSSEGTGMQAASAVIRMSMARYP